MLDIFRLPRYNIKAVWFRPAAIAQSVERILGKDEVPGSNPGSSSKTLDSPEDQGFLLFSHLSLCFVIFIKDGLFSSIQS